MEDEADAFKLQNAINLAQEWCEKSNMKINSKKSQIMNVNSGKRRGEPHTYRLRDEIIPVTKFYNDLGVVISDDLSWHLHWEKVKKDLAHLMRLLKANFKTIPDGILVRVYQSHVIQKVTFGCACTYVYSDHLNPNMGSSIINGIWTTLDKEWRKWFSRDKNCTILSDGIYTNLSLNQACIMEWQRTITRLNVMDTQLKKTDIWRENPRREGEVLNNNIVKEKGSFFHSAYKIHNQIPHDIRRKDTSRIAENKQKCKSINQEIKKFLLREWNIPYFKEFLAEKEAFREAMKSKVKLDSKVQPIRKRSNSEENKRLSRKVLPFPIRQTKKQKSNVFYFENILPFHNILDLPL